MFCSASDNPVYLGTGVIAGFSGLALMTRDASVLGIGLLAGSGLLFYQWLRSTTPEEQVSDNYTYAQLSSIDGDYSEHIKVKGNILFIDRLPHTPFCILAFGDGREVSVDLRGEGAR